jgi:glutamyl-tRNA reductase
MLARGDDPRQVLDALSHGLTTTLMHGPTQALHDVQAPERRELREFIARLFNLRAGR